MSLHIGVRAVCEAMRELEKSAYNAPLTRWGSSCRRMEIFKLAQRKHDTTAGVVGEIAVCWVDGARAV